MIARVVYCASLYRRHRRHRRCFARRRSASYAPLVMGKLYATAAAAADGD